jgi:hypothetical protein
LYYSDSIRIAFQRNHLEEEVEEAEEEADKVPANNLFHMHSFLQ